MDTPNDFSCEILSLFTNASENPQYKKEDFSEVKVSYTFYIERIPAKSEYAKITNKLNNRDTFHLSISRDGEIVENFTNRNNASFDDYIDILKRELIIGNSYELVLTIEKNKLNNVLSIYYITEFVDYLNSISFLTFLNVIEKNLNNEKLILENQAKSLNVRVFSTETILFTNKQLDSELELIKYDVRKNKVYSATSLCHWDIEKKLLLPEDLYPKVKEHTDQNLITVFQKTSLLFTTMFIFDYLSIKEKSYSYKLNGYKTFGEEIATKRIADINIDFNSVDLFYKIYQWIYSGGNTNDKISIARNIISLNYDSKTLELSKTAFEAIHSNFKIYERQNVKQYIEVRNKLSEILIDLQGKIDKIIDGFVGDYKKNIFTLLTFFISVIAIRVVSKGDFIGGFTNEIIILSYSFLLISFGIMLYSRWEFSKRISMFDKHYEQLKDRYKELLSQDELIKIFDDCNPKNKKSKSFIHQQKKLHTILWVSSITVLTIAITIIYFINNSDISCFCSKIIQFILCYTKNT